MSMCTLLHNDKCKHVLWSVSIFDHKDMPTLQCLFTQYCVLWSMATQLCLDHFPEVTPGSSEACVHCVYTSLPLQHYPATTNLSDSSRRRMSNFCNSLKGLCPLLTEKTFGSKHAAIHLIKLKNCSLSCLNLIQIWASAKPNWINFKFRIPTIIIVNLELSLSYNIIAYRVSSEGINIWWGWKIHWWVLILYTGYVLALLLLIQSEGIHV